MAVGQVFTSLRRDSRMRDLHHGLGGWIVGACFVGSFLACLRGSFRRRGGATMCVSEAGLRSRPQRPMIPITQTTFGDEGNCLSAAVASICHLSLAQVPDLRGDLWWPKLMQWMGTFGWAPISLSALPQNFTGYCLGLGDGPARGDGQPGRRHAVVWSGGPQGGIAHDPHPSRGGLVAWPHNYVVFLPLDAGPRVIG